MFFDHEKFVAANQACVDTMYSYLSISLNGLTHLTALNAHTARAMLTDSKAPLKALAGAGDPQEILTLHSSLAKSNIEKSVAYLRSVQEVWGEMQEQFKGVAEKQLGQFQKPMAELIGQVTSGLPTGSETNVGIPTFFTFTNAIFDNLNKVARQFSDIAEANMAMAGNATKGGVMPIRRKAA